MNHKGNDYLEDVEEMKTEKEVKHTSAPWIAGTPLQNHADGAGCWECYVTGIATGSKHICTVEGGHSTETSRLEVKANARLIAASPALLEACEKALKDKDITKSTFYQLQKAIKQAEGAE